MKLAPRQGDVEFVDLDAILQRFRFLLASGLHLLTSLSPTVSPRRSNFWAGRGRPIHIADGKIDFSLGYSPLPIR